MWRMIVTVLCWGTFAEAGIHTAPIILPGMKIRDVTRYPISSYRLFKNDGKGNAVAIPFQIDEIDDNGDYVLDQGKLPTKQFGNGLFDLRDELSFMGEDVGIPRPPTRWPAEAPKVLYEIKQNYLGNDSPGSLDREGAVYLGVYFGLPPPLSKKNYVVFHPSQGKVETSRYIYNFDQLNYLVVSGVKMKQRSDPTQTAPLIDSSTFYMKADLKYFLTFEVHHKDVQSQLEAFKIGPIRSIVRVSFFYKFLKLNFELGMYTEVSLFSNSVILPAIMYNPIEGQKTLNQGSGFYYGFGISENPGTLDVNTNIPKYEAAKSGLFQMFSSPQSTEQTYWLSIKGPKQTMYFEVVPSEPMRKKGNIPSLYTENISAKDAAAVRDNTKAAALGKSPVNLALYFDLTKFEVGEHLISFKLYFDNDDDPKLMQQFKSLNYWDTYHRRL